LINTARGLTKSFGERLRACDAGYVDGRLAQDLPAALREAIEPLLEQAAELSARIQQYDERIQQMARKQYPETALLTAVQGWAC